MQLFFFFLFFFRLHTLGRTLAKEPKKKKARRFFPDAIWPLGHKCPVGQCQDVSRQKKKKGNVLTRPYAEKTHCNVKAPR